MLNNIDPRKRIRFNLLVKKTILGMSGELRNFADILLISMDTDPLPNLFALINLAADPASFGAAQIVALALAVVALFVSGFVSGSEIAYFSITPQQAEELDESPSSESIRRLLASPERLLATILISNNLVNVTIVVLTSFALSDLFAAMPGWLDFLLQTVILTFLILLFGEILPKLVANTNPLRWARFAVGGLGFLQKIFWPLSSVMVRSTKIVNKVVTRQSRNITADELGQALEITDVAQDKEMLQGILKFGDTTASEIMTPRVDITGLEADMTFEEVMEVVVNTGYSRMPVFGDSQDDIRGVLYARDLLPYVDTPPGDDFDWKALMRKPYFVPESRMIDDLLEDFRKLKIHIAMVIDEFGDAKEVEALAAIKVKESVEMTAWIDAAVKEVGEIRFPEPLSVPGIIADPVVAVKIASAKSVDGKEKVDQVCLCYMAENKLCGAFEKKSPLAGRGKHLTGLLQLAKAIDAVVNAPAKQ